MDWSLPYPAQREAVLAKNMVATSQPLAAQAGIEMLRKGGNAIDAAIATAITLTVVEPSANGIGGDAFAIVHDGEKLHGLNGSGRSPALLTPESVDGEIPKVGWLPVTVPGAVSAWVALHERFGSVEFATLFEPAIAYATDGFLVSRQTAAGWKRGADRYNHLQSWCDTFLIDGKTPQVGQLMKLPDHATTLNEIAASKGESFYSGDLANQIDAASQDGGGLIRADDLASHTCEWVDPLSIDVGSAVFYELPPNGQGIAALIALKMLLAADVDLSDCDDPRVVHMQIEAMKRAFTDAYAFVGDPELVGDCSDLLCDERIAEHASALNAVATKVEATVLPRSGSTVYLATGDSSGRMVSFIQSNFEGFGSGIVVPNTGIALQNRGIGFSLDVSHPNCLGPSKRPFHTIIPAFIEQSGGSSVAFGVMGGSMQPQGHVQVACRMIFAGQNPQAALDAPRWRLAGGNKVAIEQGWNADLYDTLRIMGHDLEIAEERSVAFGGGQVVYQVNQGYVGASDQRRDGQACGV